MPILNKKKKLIVILAVLLAILLSFMVGKTFSKYVSEVRGDGMAEVATWSFKVNGQEEEVQTINLLSTYDNETLLDNKIAPGTEGNFNIMLDGTDSEVGIEYKVNIENETIKPTNLKFIYNDKEYDKIEDLANDLTGIINANDENKVRNLNIKWKWNYETGKNEQEIKTSDLQDTKDAKLIQNYKFDMIVSGTQVVPQN